MAQKALRYAAILTRRSESRRTCFVVFFRYTVDVHVVHTTALQAYFLKYGDLYPSDFYLPLKRDLKNSIFVHILRENLEN